ncbi:hypothetical protein BJ912DRAFT_922530 [Pholiota molesta]|nr:hypothetical protein BJ912DRAFT_922530 [Pholiota molesta]
MSSIYVQVCKSTCKFTLLAYLPILSSVGNYLYGSKYEILVLQYSRVRIRETREYTRVLPYLNGTVKNYSYRICLAHIVNLGNVDVMSHITQIAVVENSTAIWEYDPSCENNHILGGSLDVIAAIRTLAIKIQASGQPLVPAILIHKIMAKRDYFIDVIDHFIALTGYFIAAIAGISYLLYGISLLP